MKPRTALAAVAAVASLVVGTASIPAVSAAPSQTGALRTIDQYHHMFYKKPTRVVWSGGRLVKVVYSTPIRFSTAKQAKTFGQMNGARALRRRATCGPCPDNPRLTPAQVINVFGGDTYGPNTYTDGGKGTLHFKQTSSTTWTANLSIVNPLVASRQTGGTAEQRRSWYNPASWDWSGILGAFWDNVVQPCGNGMASGFIGSTAGR